MLTNVYVKFNYDRLRIHKALGNFIKSDNNNKKNKNNVRNARNPFWVQKSHKRFCVCLFLFSVF